MGGLLGGWLGLRLACCELQGRAEPRLRDSPLHRRYLRARQDGRHAGPL